MKRFVILFTLLFTSFATISAQQAVSLSTVSAGYCPYTFTRDLKTGVTGDDVKVLQQILNSDQRTVIAPSGVGSPGNETQSYGVATREAVKKFQALFIEYIGVANGVFGPKTRTVMNAVCNGEYYTNSKGTSYTGISTQNTVNNNINNSTTSTTTATTSSDTVPPAIYLRSNSTTISAGLSFRIIVTASEPIQTFTAESIIIEGGSVSDVRKLSPNSYSLLVTPNDGARAVVAQVEADRILDLANNKNDNASNEIRISVTPNTVTSTTSTSTSVISITSTPTTGIQGADLDNIFNRILAQVSPSTPTPTTNPQPTNCSNGATNPPYCNNQYNNTQPNYNNGSNSDTQQNSLMNMLLLSSLLGGNKGSSNNSGCSGISALFGNCNNSAKTTMPVGPQTNSANPGNNSDPTKQIVDSSAKTPDGKTPSDVPTPTVKPGEVTFTGGKVEKIYTCAAEAPSLSGETTQLRYTNGNSMFLRVLSTGDNTSKTVIRYGKDLDAQQEQAKKVSENACYVNGSLNTSKEKNICCKEVQYTANRQRYTCVPHEGLGQDTVVYYFGSKADFAAKNCTVGQTAQTNNTRQADEQATANQSDQEKVADLNKKCLDRFQDEFDNAGFTGLPNGSISTVEQKYPECKGYLVQNALKTGANNTCGNDSLTKSCIAKVNSRYEQMGWSGTTEKSVDYVIRNNPECANKISWSYFSSDVSCK